MSEGAFPLHSIIFLRYILSLGLNNIDNQTNKLENVHALHLTFRQYIVPLGPKLSQLGGSIGRGPLPPEGQNKRLRALLEVGTICTGKPVACRLWVQDLGKICREN